MRQRAAGSELDAIAAWRNTMLERVLMLCFALLTVAVAVALLKPGIFQYRILFAAILPGWALVTLALFPKTSLRLRQLALISGMLTVAVGSVAKLGFQAVNGFCLHLILVLMVALFMSRAAAWMVWAVGIVSWLAIAALVPEFALRSTDTLFDPLNIINWVRVIGIYALLSSGALVAVSFLVERMESALTRSEALFDALTQESTKRIVALEEQRDLEDQLRQSQKMEALGTLAGGIAHDFNNLLVVIINQAELAAREATTEAMRESLAQIQAAGERAASLTQRLLTFGRRQVGERAVIDLNKRVEETLLLLRRLLPATIQLDCVLNAERPRVRAADIELDQIIMNLCINARDAMPKGGRLQIRTTNELRCAPGAVRAEEYVCLEIRDSGTGMDEATRERVFEPFFTTKRKGEGTGLGLSTVHALVQQSGGFIELESAPGEGTTLRIWLPVHAGEATANAAPRWSIRAGNETILIADDDPQVRAILARRLTDHGFRVLSCEDGEQALALFRTRPQEIALVISDAVMPKLGGRELHQLLTREFGEVPFLICSGYAAGTIDSSFFDHPSRAFLQKPFDDHTLQSKVRELLDAAKARGGELSASYVSPAALPKTVS